MSAEAAVALLFKLAELEAGRPCSLNRLAKQSGHAMSSLLRELAVLQQMGLVEREGEDGQGGIVRLSAEGRRFCAEVAEQSRT